MTKDIIKLLRGGACAENTGCLPRSCACALMQDAADEIERLQAEIKHLTTPDLVHATTGEDKFVKLSVEDAVYWSAGAFARQAGEKMVLSFRVAKALPDVHVFAQMVDQGGPNPVPVTTYYSTREAAEQAREAE